MDILIRQELTEDYTMTEKVVERAFKNEEYSDKKEHFLVNRLRSSDAFIPELSLVAINQDNDIIGHILLTKIQVVDDENTTDSLALAPVSVAPEYQNKSVGSKLIRAALKKAKEIGYDSIILLGHKEYYPKFGFKPASLWNIKAPFDVPDDTFMVLELTEGTLQNTQGTVHYPKAFFE
ncbi:GNAT family N-acetyltransferase [Peribacillus simplex]|uniref:GNAT family N-acetyltransferase n=1 Tax=Peribacillus simplex TaxID=1478 RepID=UPI0024C10B3D|nr:N-acetyltransferase [Peribacillus simplex]WHY99635.1 N-acetyltransferase [Peribacillus simplex]